MVGNKELSNVTKEKEKLYVASLQHKNELNTLNRDQEQKDTNANRSYWELEDYKEKSKGHIKTVEE